MEQPASSVLSSEAMSSPRPRSVVERMAGYTPGEQPSPANGSSSSIPTRTHFRRARASSTPSAASPRMRCAAIRRSMADDFRAVAAAPARRLARHASWPATAATTSCRSRSAATAARATSWPARIRPTRSTPCSRSSLTFGSSRCRGTPAGGCRPRRCWQRRARAIFFANPNSPSGNAVPLADVEALASAYRGAGARGRSLRRLRRRQLPEPAAGGGRNVLVTRTLSKGYGLAGPAVRLRRRRSRGDRADGQGQGQLQLRRDCHRGGVRRARRSGVRARRTGGPFAPNARALAAELERRRLRGHPEPGATSCWRRRRTRRTPAGCTRRSRRAACWSASSTSRALDDKLRISVGTLRRERRVACCT